MFIIKYYLSGAILAFVLAFFVDVVLLQILLAWIGLSLSVVSGAYIFQRPKIFRKKQNGSIPIYVRWLFIPFLLGAQLYNIWARRNDKVPAIQQIDDHLFLACRLFPSDVDELQAKGIKAIVDVTAEFDGLDWTAQAEELAYLNVPVLDHQSPKQLDLINAVNWIANQIRQNKSVTVHCALGRGRSVLVVAAYLLSKYPDLTVEQALDKIHDIRQTAALNHFQIKSLNKFYSSGPVDLRDKAWIIANPVSGGGKWPQYKDEIEQRLSPHFQLKIVETTPDYSAQQLAKDAIAQGASTLIACGGDGTLSGVASELLFSEITMGIIPLGTANTLAHALFGNKSKIMPVSDACEHIINRAVETIDTAQCNENLVLLVVGIGFEQKMIEKANRQEKNEGGQLAYVRALWQAVNQNQTTTLTVKIDDQAEDTIEASSFIVANAAPFATLLAQGGGQPNFQDGQLDITWLPAAENVGGHIYSMSELAMKGFFQDFEASSVKYLKAKKIQIKSSSDIQYVVDGESYHAAELQLSVKPKSLRVYVA